MACVWMNDWAQVQLGKLTSDFQAVSAEMRDKLTGRNSNARVGTAWLDLGSAFL